MSQTPHVRLAGGRQDGRLVAVDPGALTRLHDTGEDTVVYRDQQQVWVMHDSTDNHGVLHTDERTHRDRLDHPQPLPPGVDETTRSAP